MLLAWVGQSLPAAADGRLWTLGPAGLAARVEAAGGVGAKVDGHVSAGRPAGGGIGRMLAAVRRLRQAGDFGERPDVVHAWSVEAAAMAGWVCPGARVVLSPSTPSFSSDRQAGRGRRPGWFVRRGMRRLGSVTWVGPHAPSQQVLDGWREAGVARMEAVRIDPPVELTPTEGDATAARLRQRLHWGISGEGTRVVVLLSDEPERIDAMSAILGVGLAWETGRDLRLVISPRAGQLQRALRVTEDAGRRERVIVDEAADRPWQLGQAVDAALVLGDGLSLAWARSLALPTVVPMGEPALEDAEGVEAVIARPESTRPGRIAPHISRLYDGLSEARAAAMRDRTRAAAIYDPARYRQRLAAVYAAVAAGRSVQEVVVDERGAAAG